MEGLSAVLRRFPPRAQAIRELALADESFRSLCADFAVAETMLQRLCQAPSSNEERRNEYAVLVTELLTEISKALDSGAFTRGANRGNG